jgi:uncharacterized Zn-binding protein involved in type VI secretion
MPAAARLTDIDSGHDGFPARSAISASDNVFINNLGALRVSDAWETHCDGDSCHGATLADGSPTVFVNGLPLGRVGDSLSCGGTVASGSPDVFVG